VQPVRSSVGPAEARAPAPRRSGSARRALALRGPGTAGGLPAGSVVTC